MGLSEARFNHGEGCNYISARADYVLSKFFIQNGLDTMQLDLDQLEGLIRVLQSIEGANKVERIEGEIV